MASKQGEKKSAAKKPAAKSTAKKPASKATAKSAAKKPAAKAAASKGTSAGKSSAAKSASKKGAARKRTKGVQENPVALRSSGVLDAYDAYDLPPRAETRPKQPAAARRDAYDEYDLPPRAEARPKRPAAVRRDAYDEYDLPPEPKAGKKREKPPRRDAYDELDGAPGAGGPSGGGRKRGNRGFGFVNLVLVLAILSLFGIGAWRTMEYRALAEMKAVVSRQTFYPGTTVDGVDVSEMTLEQALDYWDRQIEPAYRQAAVVLDDGTRITAQELGYASNYESVLSGAWNTGRSGSLRQRFLRASSGRAKAYRVERVNYDDGLVRRYAAAMAAAMDADPQDARLTGFDPDTYEFTFTESAEGRKLDQDALVNALESALNDGGGAISRKIEVIQPAVRREDVSSQYGMIASAVTNAESSSSNRLSNIRLAVSIINGTCLRPGERFSFNETVGQRTAARGFKVATAYSGGSVTEEVGGGICQVSTTLFNAAVKADLEINERHPHSLTVSYVDLGKDAAVDWGGKDLKFTNTSDGDVYIACTVTDDKRIRFGVFGKLLPNGETITVEGVTTGDVDYKTEYQVSFELLSGQTRKLQKGKKGHTATAYKIRWDAQGNEISRDVLCKSTYQSTPEIIEYGP